MARESAAKKSSSSHGSDVCAMRTEATGFRHSACSTCSHVRLCFVWIDHYERALRAKHERVQRAEQVGRGETGLVEHEAQRAIVVQLA
eukprot:20038-Prymnesium_polylepis.1